MIFGTPLALILGIVALFKDESKGFAIATVVIGGATCLLYLLPVIC